MALHNIMNNKIKICLDVDGVILNFMQSVSAFIEQEYNTKSKIAFSCNQYRLYDRFDEDFIVNLGFDNIKKHFEKAGHWAFLEPMPEIDLIHDLLKNPSFEISFLTSIPVHLHSDRLKNLRAILGSSIQEHQLVCVPLGESKKPYFDKIKPDFFVEDNLHNIRDCAADHKNYWINLQETHYDKSCLDTISLIEVNNLNEAIQDIKMTLENGMQNKTAKCKP